MTTNRKVTKYDFVSSDQFFQLISAKANYMNVKIVRDVYYAMIKALMQELRQRGMVRLPEFGDFFLSFYGGHEAVNVNTGRKEEVARRRTLKFRTNNILKNYLKSLSDIKIE